nr:MAG TPA: hypothetical protein [Caudoviricetes sp.]
MSCCQIFHVHWFWCRHLFYLPYCIVELKANSLILIIISYKKNPVYRNQGSILVIGGTIV